MAFLDNSGDIILDAVLTDTGRMRLAKGDGTFKITKFALADDEINYNLYDKNNPSGSAYYDLQIMQTPVLEAFTNNASSVKSKLLSISRDDLLYLPMLKLYNLEASYQQFNLGTSEDTFIIAVNDTTVRAINGSAGSDADDTSTTGLGIINGSRILGTGARIRVDQGLDTTEISKDLSLDPDLRETQYLVEMDNRLGFLVPGNANTIPADVSFVDDDNIATYYITQGDDNFSQSFTPNAASSIRGPLGTWLGFRVGASAIIKNNNYLFNVLGTAGVDLIGKMIPATKPYRFIDTFIAVTGITTGYRIEIPVRYVKQIG